MTFFTFSILGRHQSRGNILYNFKDIQSNCEKIDHVKKLIFVICNFIKDAWTFIKIGFGNEMISL